MNCLKQVLMFLGTLLFVMFILEESPFCELFWWVHGYLIYFVIQRITIDQLANTENVLESRVLSFESSFIGNA